MAALGNLQIDATDFDETADADLAAALRIAAQTVWDEVDPSGYEEFDY